MSRQLKNEEKRCMEELQCNIVVLKRSQAKVLRLNLVGSPEAETQLNCSLPPELDKSSGKTMDDIRDPHRNSVRGPAVTPTSSPEVETPFTTTEAGTSSASSSDPGTSPFFVPETNANIKKKEQMAVKERRNSDAASSDSYSESLSLLSTMEFQPWDAEILYAGRPTSKQIEHLPHRASDNGRVSSS